MENFMARRNRLTCAETFERLDDYLDRELRTDEMHRVAEHLKTCVRCASEFTFESRLIVEIRSKLARLEIGRAHV